MSAAAPTPDPPASPPASAAEAGVTREEFEALQRELEQFRAAAARIPDADSQAEQERREREAREAAERAERTAQRIGLSPADVGEIRSWLRYETREAIRETLPEIAEVRTNTPAPPAGSLAELSDDPSSPPAAGDPPAGAPPAGAPPAGDPPAPPPPPDPPAHEEPPNRPHWFHRPLGGEPQE